MTEKDQEALNIFKRQHQQWLHEPISKAVLAAINNQETLVVATLDSAAMDTSKDAEHTRRLAVQLSTIRTIKKLINETEILIKKCGSLV